jgi:hypothetical protein
MEENINSIVDTADDINLSSNSRTLFGLSLIISIVSGIVKYYNERISEALLIMFSYLSINHTWSILVL